MRGPRPEQAAEHSPRMSVERRGRTLLPTLRHESGALASRPPRSGPASGSALATNWVRAALHRPPCRDRKTQRCGRWAPPFTRSLRLPSPLPQPWRASKAIQPVRKRARTAAFMWPSWPYRDGRQAVVGAGWRSRWGSWGVTLTQACARLDHVLIGHDRDLAPTSGRVIRLARLRPHTLGQWVVHCHPRCDPAGFSGGWWPPPGDRAITGAPC